MWDLYDGTKEAFLEGYTSIRPLPDIEKTLPLYLLLNGVGGISWCIKRGKLDDPFFKENYDQVMGLL